MRSLHIIFARPATLPPAVGLPAADGVPGRPYIALGTASRSVLLRTLDLRI